MHRTPIAARLLFAFVFCVLIAAHCGCRNRCQNGAGGVGGGFFASNGTIAPPATYSLNIPSVARNQPYYQPNGGPISTTARAPIPATGAGSAGSNSGSNFQWRRPGAGNNFGLQNPNNAVPGNQVPRGRLAEVNPPINNGSSVLVGGLRQPHNVLGNQALPATGSSFTDTRNFATTQIDERLDSTRVPVTDATRVRATAQNFIASSATIQPNRAAFVQPTAQTFAAQQPFFQPGSNVIAANSYIVPAQRQNYTAQPYIVPGNSATYSAAANNAIGWRNRELGSRAR